MKYGLTFICLLLIVKQHVAQDTIVKKNKQVVIAKIIEISETEVIYKRFALPEGPLYIDNKSDIAYIAYPNGQKDKFPEQQKAEPLPIVSFPPDYLRISPNRITYTGFAKWDQKGKTMNESELHSVLLSTNDRDIMQLTKSAEFYKKNQYIGFATIPCGIAGISLGAMATIRMFGAYGMRIGNPENFILGSLICAAAAVSTNIYGVNMFHLHRKKNAQAIELYNQTY